MADHIVFKVKVTPIEELTDEQGNTVKTISGEVGVSLGGGGESVDIANYSGSASVQGYKGNAVNYIDATHSNGGTALLTAERDFIFIKNTGYKFSSTTVLGSVTTDYLMVAIREVAFGSGSDGGYQNSSNVAQIHFYEVAWLRPGAAVILPCGASNVGISDSQFGNNTNDLSSIGEASGDGQAKIYVRTYLSNGSAASDGNAVEYLSVT